MSAGAKLTTKRPGGNREPDRRKSRAHALARFRNGLIPEPNDDDAVGAAGELHLHFDSARFESGESYGGCVGAGLHRDRPLSTSDAGYCTELEQIATKKERNRACASDPQNLPPGARARHPNRGNLREN
jgi:hypothetical protein